MRKLRIALLIFAAFDFFILGNTAGVLPLTPVAAAQNKPQYPFVSGAPDCLLVPSAPFTAVADSIVYDNRNQGCTTWHLVYNSQGFSALNISFKSADDSGNGPGAFANWGTSGGTLASGTTLPLTATTSGQATGYKYRPFVKISVTSVTGGGAIWPMLYGYRPGGADSNSPGGTNIQGVIAGGVNGSTVNPVVIGGCITVTGNVCAGNIAPFLVDSSSGRMIVQGAGSGNGLAQSMAVFSLPNPITAQAPSGPIVLAAVTTATNIKGTAGGLYLIHALNTTAAVCYIQIFTVTSGSVTLGTTTPTQVLGLPANGAGTLSAIPFSILNGTSGISVAATTTPTGAATCATGAVVSALAQ